jgi:hypothetical protein
LRWRVSDYLSLTIQHLAQPALFQRSTAALAADLIEVGGLPCNAFTDLLANLKYFDLLSRAQYIEMVLSISPPNEIQRHGLMQY